VSRPQRFSSPAKPRHTCKQGSTTVQFCLRLRVDPLQVASGRGGSGGGPFRCCFTCASHRARTSYSRWALSGAAASHTATEGEVPLKVSRYVRPVPSHCWHVTLSTSTDSEQLGPRRRRLLAARASAASPPASEAAAEGNGLPLTRLPGLLLELVETLRCFSVLGSVDERMGARGSLLLLLWH